MSRDAQTSASDERAGSSPAEAAAAGGSDTARPVVRAHDGEPVTEEMASAAAVAAVVAIRQVAAAYAAHQAAAAAQSLSRRHDRAGFNAPRRQVRRRLPATWTSR